MVCIIRNYKLLASCYIAQKLCAIGVLIAAFRAFALFKPITYLIIAFGINWDGLLIDST